MGCGSVQIIRVRTTTQFLQLKFSAPSSATHPLYKIRTFHSMVRKALRKVNISTPAIVPASAGVAGKSRPERKVDEVEEISMTPQLKSQDKAQPFKETNAAKFKRIKLTA
ncbi:hypothetical protein FRC00_005485, partial [Tulasnella sp. 408]